MSTLLLGGPIQGYGNYVSAEAVGPFTNIDINASVGPFKIIDIFISWGLWAHSIL
jgi:hypothetical protein